MRTTRLAGDAVGPILIGPSPPQISTCSGYYGNASLKGHDGIDRPTTQDISLHRIPTPPGGQLIHDRARKDVAAIKPSGAIVAARVTVVAKDIRGSLPNEA